jgi:hypothetical protein
VQKTPIVGAPGRGICSVLFLYTFRWFILPELTIATGDIYQFSAKLTQGEAIRFIGPKFITDLHDDQGLFPEGNDLSTIFMGMASSRSPSLYAMLEESPSEDNLSSSDGESSGFPIPQGCNVVTSTIPIISVPPSEETLML